MNHLILYNCNMWSMTYLYFLLFYITAPLEMVVLTTSWINLMRYLKDITNIDKMSD